MEIIKIGMTGSSRYENKIQIKETIFKLKQTFGNTLVIVSSGKTNGADKYIKKYALEFECKYKEFNPAHTKKNIHSVLTEGFYDKPYSPRNFFISNALMIKYIDYMIVFVEKGKGDKGIDSIISETQRKGKKLVILD